MTPQWELVREQIHGAINEVLESRQFILGRFVEAFEEEFAAYCGVRHAVAVNSGTSALHVALLAAGVGPGDEVITVPFTFAATVAAIHYCGARPVFVDIDPVTYTIDTEQLGAAITPATRAILPVHLYGHPAGMDRILALARRHGLSVIEDAAQAHGALYNGRRAGSIGDAGCFSFYPSKNLGACGEGGMITTHDPELAKTARLLRDWGQDRKYHHAIRGFNYRMEGLQGAILKVKLAHLEAWTEERRAAAARYDALLTDVPVIRPVSCPGVRHVFHTYTIRAGNRDRLQADLTAAGVGTAIHYPRPVHLQPAYADPEFPQGSLPQAEKAAAQVLSLPMYAGIPEAHLTGVAEALRQALGVTAAS